MNMLDPFIVQTNLGLLVGIFEEAGKVAAYQDLADRLSKVARKEKPWTWRYVLSVHTGTIAPSKKFAHAVELLVAEMDGLPAFVAETEPITVHARPGSVRANAIVIGQSKPCANPACTVHFIPIVPWQKYCPRCRKQRKRS